jgi:hypothetical protein
MGQSPGERNFCEEVSERPQKGWRTTNLIVESNSENIPGVEGSLLRDTTTTGVSPNVKKGLNVLRTTLHLHSSPSSSLLRRLSPSSRSLENATRHLSSPILTEGPKVSTKAEESMVLLKWTNANPLEAPTRSALQIRSALYI